MLEPLTPNAALDVLRHGTVGRLGLISDGRPYVVPITYAFDAHTIIGHSGPGAKLDALRHADRVCFEVEEIDDLRHWRSVIAWGRYEELHGEARERALHLLTAAIMPQLATADEPGHGGTEPADHGGDDTTAAVYRVHLDEIHGRFETPGTRNVKLRVGDTTFAMAAPNAAATPSA
jgi:nitroimidazol reductase NimA-like FMN-containing flavoprotein (pyridoxamine 5'-phosphate oxidase superfamily)